MFVGALAKCKALSSKLAWVSGSWQFDKRFIIPMFLTSFRPATLLKKETLAQAFSCEFCKNF